MAFDSLAPALRLDRPFILRCLGLYKPESINIVRAVYANNELVTQFDLYALAYHEQPLDHTSRVQIVHYLGQAAFVLAGCLAKDGSLDPLDMNSFLKLVDQGHCTFSRLELKFRRFIPNTAGCEIVLRATRIRRLHGTLAIHMEFSVGSGACVGTAIATVPASDIRRSEITS